MDECIFCKIIKGEIPCEKIYEDDDTLAFIDIAPVKKGHTLVIPKQHHKDIFDTPDELLEKVIVTGKKVALAVKEAVGADGISFGQSNGKAAGQVIFHLHFHIMPRFNDDGLTHWPKEEYTEGEMKEFAQKIKNKI